MRVTDALPITPADMAIDLPTPERAGRLTLLAVGAVIAVAALCVLVTRARMLGVASIAHRLWPLSSRDSDRREPVG